MKKLFSISLYCILLTFCFRVGYSFEELSILKYDPDKAYAVGSQTIISIENPQLYTSIKEVPAEPKGSNAPNGANGSTYWEDSTITAQELSKDIGEILKQLPAEDVREKILATLPPSNPTITIPSGLTSASNEAFVMQQYLDFLGRDGDAEGIAYWKGELDNGTQTRADCVNNFVFSDEFQSRVAPVSRLYLAYFLRLPDTDGLSYWINNKLNGMSLNDISDQFASVQEFSDKYGSLNNSGFINLVYNNVLSRNPDSEGVTYWNNQMTAGMSRGEVMTGFSESPEYQQITLNQIRIIAFYYGMLGRAPDQGGFDFWVAKLNNGDQPNELIDGFINSPEYQGRSDRQRSEGGFGN
jgi:hypothetical protein